MPRNLSTSSPTFPPPPAARHYHSDLSIWLSVDPMADKYPGLSPYTYCADNPVKLVDPNGREIGEYFDMEGKWLGTDGKNDFRVYFVEDPESQAQLRKDVKEGKYTTSSINSKVATTTFVLNEIINVFDRTANEDNNGNYEEGAAFDNDILPIRSDRGTVQHVDLKLNSGSTSIHSHTFVEFFNDKGEPCLYTPENPSDADKEVFKNFTLNVIVGKTQCDPGIEGCRRYRKAYFYNNASEKILDLKIGTLRRIAWETNHSFHLPK